MIIHNNRVHFIQRTQYSMSWYVFWMGTTHRIFLVFTICKHHLHIQLSTDKWTLNSVEQMNTNFQFTDCALLNGIHLMRSVTLLNVECRIIIIYYYLYAKYHKTDCVYIIIVSRLGYNIRNTSNLKPHTQTALAFVCVAQPAGRHLICIYMWSLLLSISWYELNPSERETEKIKNALSDWMMLKPD